MVVETLRKFFAGAISKLDERSSRQKARKEERRIHRSQVKIFVTYFGFTPRRKNILPVVAESDLLNVRDHLQRLGSRFLQINREYATQKGVILFHLRRDGYAIPQDVLDRYEALFQQREIAFKHFSDAFAIAQYFHYQSPYAGIEGHVPDREQNVILMEIIAPEQPVTEELFEERSFLPV
jgi:hypothetical protein